MATIEPSPSDLSEADGNIQARAGAKLLLERARWFGWRRVIWADGACAGKLRDWVAAARLEIVKQSEAPGFTPSCLAAGVVERPYACPFRYRRLARDDAVKNLPLGSLHLRGSRSKLEIRCVAR